MGLLDKAKSLLVENVDKVEQMLDKAGEIVDEKTGGTYADTIGKVQEAAKKALSD